MALTCGEDGNVKLWELPHKLKTYSTVSKEESQDVIMADSSDDKAKKKLKKEKKEKKNKKDKKDKKKKKDIRFKPY